MKWKRGIVFSLALLAAASVFLKLRAASVYNSAPISDFGGLNTLADPLYLTKQTPDSENIISDEGSGIKPRLGYISFSTESSRNLYSFYVSNGSKYLVTQSSGILKATTGGSNFDIFVATVDPSVTTSVTSLGDKLYFTNTTDGLKYWDLSNVVKVGSFRARWIATHKERLWLAGVVGDERTVYISEYADGTNFTLAVNPTDTDPARITVQGALDDILTGLYATFNDQIVWFKQRSFGMIDGDRRSNFLSREYSNNVGCSYPDTIENCNGILRWLGNDRIVYEFDGANYYPISNNDIKNYLEAIVQGDLNQRQWVQQFSYDWTAGTVGVGVDTTTLVNSMGLFSGVTSSTPIFTATGTQRDAGGPENAYLNASTATTGAFAVKFIANTSLELSKVHMAFSYRSSVVVPYSSWVTLHTGSTYPSSIALDTSTNKVIENTNTSGSLMKISTDYLFAHSDTVDKRLSVGTTYWFVLHTTYTANTTTQISTYGFTGAEQTFSVPVGVSSTTVDLFGASGSTSTGSGAPGGFLHSTMTVTYGQTYYVYVGQSGGNGALKCGEAGWNGGCNSSFDRYSGGGATDIRYGGNAIADRVLVAGGGGGQGENSDKSTDGGAARYNVGDKGADYDASTIGGFGGDNGVPHGGAGGPGGAVQGDSGALGTAGCNSTAGGCGGGGYYGGGQGGASVVGVLKYAGGGGGTGYNAFINYFDSPGPQYIDAIHYGNGFATFTYIANPIFYANDLSDNLSSTTLLFTSSFVASGSNFTQRTFTSAPFQVYFSTFSRSGSWKSRTFDAGTKYSAWTSFGIGDTTSGGGAISYNLFVSTINPIDPTDSTTYASSQSVTNGQVPTLPTDRYVAITADFSRPNFSTATAYTSSLTLNFTEGSSLRTFGKFIKNRYWMTVAVSSTSNNKVLVYDKNKQWQIYTIPISAIVNYTGTFYFGNTNGIFQAEYGHDDNGASIPAYYVTKTYIPTSVDAYSTLMGIYMTTTRSSSTLNTQAFIDGDDLTPVSFSSYTMTADTAYQNFQLPFANGGVPAKYVKFKWSIDSVYDWRILNASLYFWPDIEPQESVP